VNEVTFTFRPMPALAAETHVATINTEDCFVVIDAIPGCPIYVTGATALALSAAFKSAYETVRPKVRL